MVEIINQTDVSNIWTYISSYYEFMTEAEKAPVEDYWKALLDGLEALRFNLSESYLSSSLTQSKGYIEDRYKDFTVKFADVSTVPFDDIVITTPAPTLVTNKNYYIEYYVVGTQVQNGITYETAVTPKRVVGNDDTPAVANITLTWVEQDHLDGYQVYSKLVTDSTFKKLDMSANPVSITDGVCTFIDDGTYTELVTELNIVNNTVKYYLYDIADIDFHVYMPELTRVATGDTFTVGVDFDVLAYKQIAFYYKDGLTNFEKFICPLDIKLVPIYENLLQNLFRDDSFAIGDLLDSDAYPSYITYSGNTQVVENRLQHFIKLSHAILLKMRQGLSMSRLQDVISLYYNVPFSYDAGVIESGQSANSIIIGTLEYIIPETLTLLKSVGDSVNKFEILCSGVGINDYVSNPGIISTISSGQSFYYTLGVHVPAEVANLSYYIPYVAPVSDVSNLLNNICPPGTIYKYY